MAIDLAATVGAAGLPMLRHALAAGPPEPAARAAWVLAVRGDAASAPAIGAALRPALALEVAALEVDLGAEATVNTGGCVLASAGPCASTCAACAAVLEAFHTAMLARPSPRGARWAAYAPEEIGAAAPATAVALAARLLWEGDVAAVDARQARAGEVARPAARWLVAHAPTLASVSALARQRLLPGVEAREPDILVAGGAVLRLRPSGRLVRLGGAGATAAECRLRAANRTLDAAWSAAMVEGR